MPLEHVISFKIEEEIAEKLEATANSRELSKILRKAIGQVITKYIPPEELKEIIIR